MLLRYLSISTECNVFRMIQKFWGWEKKKEEGEGHNGLHKMGIHIGFLQRYLMTRKLGLERLKMGNKRYEEKINEMEDTR